MSLLDMMHPGESWQSKAQEIHVLTLGINRCCALGVWLHVYLSVCSPVPAGRWAPRGGIRQQQGAWGNPPCQSRAAFLNLFLHHDCSMRMAAVNTVAALTFKQGLVIDQQSTSPSLDEWNIVIMPTFYITLQKSISMTFIMMSEYIFLILCLGKQRYRELKRFNNLWNECRFTDSHSSDTGQSKKHQKQPKSPGWLTLYFFPVMSEKV